MCVCVSGLGKPKLLRKVRSKELQGMLSRLWKARIVARRVMCGDHDDVFASTPPLAVARTLLTLTSIRNLGRNKYAGLFDIKHRRAQRRSLTDTMVNKNLGCLDVATTIGLGHKTMLSELYGTRKASKLWIRSHLRALQTAVGQRV